MSNSEKEIKSIAKNIKLAKISMTSMKNKTFNTKARRRDIVMTIYFQMSIFLMIIINIIMIIMK